MTGIVTIEHSNYGSAEDVCFQCGDPQDMRSINVKAQSREFTSRIRLCTECAARLRGELWRQPWLEAHEREKGHMTATEVRRMTDALIKEAYVTAGSESQVPFLEALGMKIVVDENMPPNTFRMVVPK